MGGPLTAPLRAIPTASSPPPNDVANGICQEAFAEIDITVSVSGMKCGAGGSRPLGGNGPHPRATHIESFYGGELHKSADLSSAIEERTSITSVVAGSAGPLGAGRDLIMTLL